jgi:hypothetical protein
MIEDENRAKNYPYGVHELMFTSYLRSTIPALAHRASILPHLSKTA